MNDIVKEINMKVKKDKNKTPVNKNTENKTGNSESSGASITEKLADIALKSYKTGGLPVLFVITGIILLIVPAIPQLDTIKQNFVYFYIIGVLCICLSLVVYLPYAFWRRKLTDNSLKEYYARTKDIINAYMDKKAELTDVSIANLIIAIGGLAKIYMGKDVMNIIPPKPGDEGKEPNTKGGVVRAGTVEKKKKVEEGQKEDYIRLRFQ